MSLSHVILDLKSSPEIEREIENALMNSGIQFNKEQISEYNHKLYLPPYYWAISIAVHIIRSKIDSLEGDFKLPDGKTFDLTLDGIEGVEKSFN